METSCVLTTPSFSVKFRTLESFHSTLSQVTAPIIATDATDHGYDGDTVTELETH